MIYYFIGIKGSGMSALACIMHDLGYKVMGSDKEDHFFTQVGLEQRNIQMLPFNENNLKEGMIVVQGNAFNDDFIEVKKAHELGLQIYSYQNMIAELTNNTKLIAISGCHGKTTTTTMMSKVFENIGINYLIGDGTGYAKKENEYFALEACEFKRHFLSYNPYYAVITNVGLDHTDYYKDLNDVIDAFTEYASKARKACVVCGDDTNARNLKIDKPVIYYGLKENNDVVAKNITHDNEITTADIYIKGEYYEQITFPFVGDHLLLNALAVISVCYLEGIDKEEVKNQIAKIKHAKRRFIEEKFMNNIIIDDYAHHPTEVKVTIEAAKKKYPDKQVIAIFKAHTKSRVKYFHKEFADALNIADKCYVMPIGEDRIEVGYEDVTHFDILKDTKNGEEITLDTAEKLLPYENVVLLFMSSKDIYFLEDKYKQLKKNS